MRKFVHAAIAALMATVGAIAFAPQASAQEVDIYITPGYHEANGRQWLTTCEPYSVTHRCTTQIWATQVSYVNGRFVQKNDWYFNNLTYRPSPRHIWKSNPLAAFGKVGPTEHKWTASDGREWRTECDTSVTGRGGCRNWVKADVISRSGSGYKWLREQWVLNSMVRFGDVQPLPEPVLPVDPDLSDVVIVPIVASDVPATIGGMTRYAAEGIVLYTRDIMSEAGVGVVAFGDLGVSLEEWAMVLLDPVRPNAKTVCGVLDNSGVYGCIFVTPKYGSVMAVNVDTSDSDVTLVATTLSMSMR